MLMVTLDFAFLFMDYCQVLTALLLKFRGTSAAATSCVFRCAGVQKRSG